MLNYQRVSQNSLRNHLVVELSITSSHMSLGRCQATPQVRTEVVRIFSSDSIAVQPTATERKHGPPDMFSTPKPAPTNRYDPKKCSFTKANVPASISILSIHPSIYLKKYTLVKSSLWHSNSKQATYFPTCALFFENQPCHVAKYLGSMVDQVILKDSLRSECFFAANHIFKGSYDRMVVS